ncbi:hypothetical protein GCM10009120_50150 [Sphingobacterium siyangense subsp. cladoniae]
MGIPNHRVQLGNELEKISRYEASHNRPLLSSLVLRKNDFEEGNGFYKMCEELGHGNWKKLKKDEIFQFQIIKETINFWGQQENYMKFK